MTGHDSRQVKAANNQRGSAHLNGIGTTDGQTQACSTLQHQEMEHYYSLVYGKPLSKVARH